MEREIDRERETEIGREVQPLQEQKQQRDHSQPRRASWGAQSQKEEMERKREGDGAESE